MAYKVTVEGDEAEYIFVNCDDAICFATMAVEYGRVEDYHYDKDENGNYKRVSDGWLPAEVTIIRVEEAQNE